MFVRALATLVFVSCAASPAPKVEAPRIVPVATVTGQSPPALSELGVLRQSAAEHTNAGKAKLVTATETGEGPEQVRALRDAADEYTAAAAAWEKVLPLETPERIHETRYWIADAHRQRVRIELVLFKLGGPKGPTPEAIDAARRAAEAALPNQHGELLQRAAFFVVDTSDAARDLAYFEHATSKGVSGYPQRAEVTFDGKNVATRKVVRLPIPRALVDGNRARDTYRRVVPESLDTMNLSDEYAYIAAHVNLVYGHLDEARSRFDALWTATCPKNEYGIKAWEQLVTIAKLERDAAAEARLVAAEHARPCWRPDPASHARTR